MNTKESNELEKVVKENTKARMLRGIVMWVVTVLLISVIFFSVGRKPSTAEKVWHPEMTLGDINAKNHYIMYTDLMCPYCDIFARQLKTHKEEFIREYIEGKNILWEIRMTDFLREFGDSASILSEWSAEASYCAKRENKFWDFYEAALDALERDYHSKGIGVSKNAPKIADMKADYWLEVGASAGLGEQFANCYQKHEALQEVRQNTERAARSIKGGGLPYFQFNDFTTSGIDPAMKWADVKLRLDAGIK